MRTSSIPGFSKAAFLLAFVLACAGVASAQTGQYAYLTNNFLGNTISVVDTGKSSLTFGTVVATISTVGTPFGIAISPDNTRLYVTDFQSDSVSNTIEVYTLSFSSGAPPVSATLLTTITLPTGASPNLIAITPDGSRAYVADYGTNQVSVIDTVPTDAKYNTDIADIGVGSSPIGVAITPDGKHAYVTNSNDNTISVIDTSSNTVSTTISTGVGLNPTDIAITPDGTRAYFTNFDALQMSNPDTVQMIDISSDANYNTIQATIGLDSVQPWGIAITPDGSAAYVAGFYNGAITVLGTNPSDAGTYNNIISPILSTDSGQGTGVAITADGLHAIVSDWYNNQALVIDSNSGDHTNYNTVVANPVTAANGGPWNIAVTPGQGPQTFAFAAFSAKLGISSTGFGLNGSFTLGAGSPGIDLSTQPLTLSLDGFSMTIPAKSFQSVSVHHFLVFSGTVNATYQNATVPISVSARIVDQGGRTYTIQISATGIDLTALTTPVEITLTIGPNTGSDTPSNGHHGKGN
jgi:YVTN family beta-propeller protein